MYEGLKKSLKERLRNESSYNRAIRDRQKRYKIARNIKSRY